MDNVGIRGIGWNPTVNTEEFQRSDAGLLAMAIYIVMGGDDFVLWKYSGVIVSTLIGVWLPDSGRSSPSACMYRMHSGVQESGLYFKGGRPSDFVMDCCHLFGAGQRL